MTKEGNSPTSSMASESVKTNVRAKLRQRPEKPLQSFDTMDSMSAPLPIIGTRTGTIQVRTNWPLPLLTTNADGNTRVRNKAERLAHNNTASHSSNTARGNRDRHTPARPQGLMGARGDSCRKKSCRVSGLPVQSSGRSQTTEPGQTDWWRLAKPE